MQFGLLFARVLFAFMGVFLGGAALVPIRPNVVWILGEDTSQKLAELRAALRQWMEETKAHGAVPETELIQRGLVKNALKAYEQRKLIV